MTDDAATAETQLAIDRPASTSGPAIDSALAADVHKPGEVAATLPPELLQSAARRLRTAAGIFVVAYVIAYCSFWALAPRSIMPPEGKIVGHCGAIFAITSSFVVLALGRSKSISPARLIDIGLVYEVIGALGIFVAEYGLAWQPGEIPRGISWAAYWIVCFPFIVPSTPGKSALAAVVSASMAPIAIAVNMAFGGTPLPDARQLVLLLMPNFIAAATAFIASRVVFALGREIERVKQLGSYRLVERLGQGGMGEVWRAEHRLLARPAAIKLVKQETLGGSSPGQRDVLLKRFRREAEATAQLTSPHTVELYDFGVTRDGTFYYAMELLDGVDLDELVQKHGPLPAERAIHVLRQACDSLADAHHHGLVHRDVKPANMYLCRRGLKTDVVKVLDFGLVRPLRTETKDTRLTADNSVQGTPAFMPPEMALGEVEVDGRADLYSLGCVAFWLLTGELVFDAPSVMRMVVCHVSEAPRRVSALAQVPPELDALIDACLAKSPDKRPRSASELERRLAEIAATLPAWSEEDGLSWWAKHRPERPRPPVTEAPKREDKCFL